MECIFRALQGPLNLHCIRIRAVAVRTPNTALATASGTIWGRYVTANWRFCVDMMPIIDKASHTTSIYFGWPNWISSWFETVLYCSYIACED